MESINSSLPENALRVYANKERQVFVARAKSGSDSIKYPGSLVYEYNSSSSEDEDRPSLASEKYVSVCVDGKEDKLFKNFEVRSEFLPLFSIAALFCAV